MIYEVCDIETNVPTLVSTVAVGGWPSSVSGKPSDVRFLQVKLPAIAMDDAHRLAQMALAHDWTGSGHGEVFYADADGQILPQPQSPGSQYTWDWATFQWLDVRSEQEKYDSAANKVRSERNRLLASSDWTDTASAPSRLGQALYDEWQTYRQALRDVTSQAGFPFDVVYPAPPAS